MPTITRIETTDIRFPTGEEGDGSDAMVLDPDYSAAYCILHTDEPGGPEGHGLTFTIGRGNELCVAAIETLGQRLVGLDVDEACADMGGLWRHVIGDSQLRWLGPEKGVIHLATAAVVNAMWDLYAKREGKPLWRLLADMTPAQIVSLVDWRYLTDALEPSEAVDLLEQQAPTRAERIARLDRDGYPAYVTSAGWMGYPDEKVAALAAQGLAGGWERFKMTVGLDLDDDMRRAGVLRDVIGPDRTLMMDANQVWGVGQAIEWMDQLKQFNPLFIEEPTSPDDVLGHATIARAIEPIAVATGEHAHNAVMFKQFLQAGALGFCQIDSCRLGGVNEVVAVLLLATKFGVPVVPHAGGVGLPEYVRHLSAFDYIAVSASLDNRMIEYTAHLHEHFHEPAAMRNGRYVLPVAPGYATMRAESRAAFSYPTGPEWASR